MVFDIVFVIMPDTTYYRVLLPSESEKHWQMCQDLIQDAHLTMDTAHTLFHLPDGMIQWDSHALLGRYAVSAWGPEAMQRLSQYETLYLQASTVSQ